jgi:hypothetical protein
MNPTMNATKVSLIPLTAVAAVMSLLTGCSGPTSPASVPTKTPQVVSTPAPDDSTVRPPVAESDVTIIRRAKEILSSEAKWNRADDRMLRPEATTFSLYTAIQKATMDVTGSFTHRAAIMQEARFAIEEVAPGKKYGHRLMGYNNDPTTTFEDIKRVFALTEARIVKRLKDGQ